MASSLPVTGCHRLSSPRGLLQRDDVVTYTRAPTVALWDAYVSRAFGRVVTAFAAVDNFTDSQDPNVGVALANSSAAPLYRPEAGRTVRAGLRIQWTRK